MLSSLFYVVTKGGVVSMIFGRCSLPDNAVAESFFKTLKRKLVRGRNYSSREEARQEVFKYIELHYNTKRMHSYLAICRRLNTNARFKHDKLN
ncbi:MAG: IS3 family transposase [Clostridiaceae bacterium]|nr:IS3 family transposase [Clostridiaceae bacterium]